MTTNTCNKRLFTIMSLTCPWRKQCRRWSCSSSGTGRWTSWRWNCFQILKQFEESLQTQHNVSYKHTPTDFLRSISFADMMWICSSEIITPQTTYISLITILGDSSRLAVCSSISWHHLFLHHIQHAELPSPHSRSCHIFYRVPTLLLTKYSRTFSGPPQHFPGLFHSQQDVTY